MNTPSHHRVHHGSDLKYLDKNHAGILIIWDRLFGTFQPEEERPTYGLTKNINSFNPFVVALKTWGELFKSAMKAGSLKIAINYFIQPPGWSHDGSTKTVRQMKISNDFLARKEVETGKDSFTMFNNDKKVQECDATKAK